MTHRAHDPVHVIALPLGETPEVAGFYALGLLHAYARQWQDERLTNSFAFQPIKSYGFSDISTVIGQLAKHPEPAIYLFSSFSWTHEANLKAAAQIREFSPGSLIIFGGADIPRRKEWALQLMADQPVIDIAVLGEGEETFARILDQVRDQCLDHGQPLRQVDVTDVTGLTGRARDGRIIYTGMRERITDVDSIPSPYLNGVFDESVYNGWVLTETNRGCPFGCTFCDWGGGTLSKVRKFDMQRIQAEIELFAAKKVQACFFCDANFGSLKRDMEIADMLVDSKTRTGHPVSFHVSYAKNATKRVAYIVKSLYEHRMIERGTIAFQTLDQETLENIDRGNIKTKSFQELLAIFHRSNIPVNSDLLIGMPGQTVNTYLTDLSYLFDTHVIPSTYLLRVLPNAPMADPAYQEQHAMQLNERGNVISTSSYQADDWQRMIRLKFANDVVIQEGFLKYILYYLQVEHGINAMQVVGDLVDGQEQYAHRWPVLHHFMSRMQNWNRQEMPDFLQVYWTPEDSKPVLDNLDCFYQDVFTFLREQYGVTISAEEQASLSTLQKAVVQRPNRSLPDEHPVAHDVIAYLSQLHDTVNVRELPPSFQPLKSFGPGTVHTPAQKNRQQRYGYARPFAEGLPHWPLTITGLGF